jgi:predicted nucleotidyltransferase
MTRIARKRHLALERAKAVCEYLSSLGAKEVYLFGSALSDDFRDHSDIDFAVAGLTREHIYRVESEIERLLAGMPFDLGGGNCPGLFCAKNSGEGKALCLPYSSLRHSALWIAFEASGTSFGARITRT